MKTHLKRRRVAGPFDHRLFFYYIVGNDAGILET